MKKTVSVLFMFAGILFAICLLISNILATKIILIGSWAAPAGVLIFPIAYIINDVIVEVWGYKKARLIIWSGFAVNLLAALFFTLAIVVPAAPFWQNQAAFSTILGSTPRIIAASLLAYLVGSFLNAFVMSKVKVLMKGKDFSVRAILSTLIGEAADSFIFIIIAFAGNLPLNVLIGMIFTQACIKTAYEIVILPFTIVVVKWVKKVEGIDTFDESISYNPFSINQI
ncbi:MAG TPA: queuosine precursor transporter [Prolixibacteraceae bacterium]|nr:queuosine precursor transporter [Prolixibacteraceae bacterium]